MRTIPLYLIFTILCSACSSLPSAHNRKNVRPELGTIGVYKDYLLKEVAHPKTVVSLDHPVRLQWEKTPPVWWKTFQKKEGESPKDSVSLRIGLLDPISLIQQLNGNITLLEYLKKNPELRLVHEVDVLFPSEVLSAMEQSDAVYLVPQREKALALELRKGSELLRRIEFGEGTILDYEFSKFCWGEGRRKRVEIFDLTPSGSSCGEDTYSSAKKAKEKNTFEIRFK